MTIRAPFYVLKWAPEYPIGNRTWTLNLLQGTLRPIVPLPPGDQLYDRPPAGYIYAQQTRTYLYRNTLLLLPPTQFGGLPNYEWQIAEPRPDNPALRTWTQNPATLRVVAGQPPGDQVTGLPPIRELRAQDLRTWTWNYNRNLIGKDVLPPGDQWFGRPYVPPFPVTLRTWIDRNPLLPQTPAELPPGDQLFGRQLVPPFPVTLRTWIDRNPLLPQFIADLPVGEQRTELPPIPDLRAADLRTWTFSFNPNLFTIFVAELLAGTAIDQTPRAYPEPATRTWTWNYNQNLIGQDALPVGDRLYDRTPDQPYLGQTWIGLRVPPAVAATPFSQDDWPLPKIAPQPDRTWLWSYNLNLIGQDQLPVGDRHTDLPPRDPRDGRSWTVNLLQSTLTPLPIGEQVYDLPPRGAAPSNQLYAWSWRYNLNLIGQDALPIGEQITDLPPRGPAQPDRTWISSLNLALLSGQIALPFNQYDWPLPKIAAQPDRTWTWKYNQNLIAQDQLPAGKQVTDLPPRAYDRANDLRAWIQAVNLALTVQPFALPFNQSDWPNPRGPQQPDRGFATSFNLNLIGKDQLPTGIRLTDLPPRAHLEPATRTWIDRFNLNLIGQDRLPTGARVYDLPPIGYAHPQQQRTWLWSYNQNLIGQDVLPTGRIITDLPPRDHLRPQDLRTWINFTSLALTTGQVALPFNQYAWPLPQIAPQPDRSFSASYNRDLVGQDRFPPGTRLTDLPPIGPYYSDALRSFLQSPAVPPVVVPPQADHHDMPFFASMGQLKSW